MKSYTVSVDLYLNEKTVSFILFSNIDNLTRDKPFDGVDGGVDVVNKQPFKMTES